MKHKGSLQVGCNKGGMFARRATFLLTIRTSAPDLPSHGEAPQVDQIALHTFPTKHVAYQSNICEFSNSNCHLYCT